MPTTLSSTELTRMRAVIEQTYTSTATVKRPSGTSDGRGGKAATLTTVSTSQVCRLGAMRDGFERQLGERTTPVTYFKIYLPHGADVKAKDQLVIGTTTYEIVDITSGRSINLADIATVTRLK